MPHTVKMIYKAACAVVTIPICMAAGVAFESPFEKRFWTKKEEAK